MPVLADALEPRLEAVHVDVDDGRGEEREHLADDEATDDGDAEGAAKLGADAGAESERQSAEEGGHGSHQNGAEAQEAGFVNGVERRGFLFALELDGEIDHEDGVLLDDADQEDDADEGDHVQVGTGKFDGENRADAGAGDGGKNGDGVDEAFIEDAENDVNGNESSDDENELRRA